MTLQAVAIPNATKTPQSVAGASHDFNDVHFITACQFARRPHAATCIPGSDSFITSTAAGIAPGDDLYRAETYTPWNTSPLHGAWAFPGVTFFRADLVKAISTGRTGLPPWPQAAPGYADPLSNFGGRRTTAVRFS